MIPTTEPAKKIAAIFNRRLSTGWSEREVKAYKALVKDGLFHDLTDLALIERYHNAERKKGDKGIQRRDLLTFLNNFRGELDRAREWNARVKSRTGYTKKEESNGAKPLSETEFKEAGKLGKAILSAWLAGQQPSQK